MGELYKSRALVLFRRAWKENDEIVGLLTPEYGRLDVVVRGSKQLKSGWVGKLEPFVELQGVFARGHKFSYLTQADIVANFSGIRETYSRLCWGGYLLDLWAAVSVEAAEQAAEYELLKQALTVLERADNFRLGCCWAEWQLLNLLGCALQTRGCVRCGKRPLAALALAEGGLLCADCAAQASGSSEQISGRLLAMVQRLPFLTAEVALTAAADSTEMRLLESIVWRHWCHCGLPRVRTRSQIEGLP